MDALSPDVRVAVMRRLPDSRLALFGRNVPPEVYASRPSPLTLPRRLAHAVTGPKWDGDGWAYCVDGVRRVSERTLYRDLYRDRYLSDLYGGYRRSVYSYQVHGMHYREEED